MCSSLLWSNMLSDAVITYCLSMCFFTCVTIYNCTQSRVIPRHVLSLPCFSWITSWPSPSTFPCVLPNHSHKLPLCRTSGRYGVYAEQHECTWMKWNCTLYSLLLPLLYTTSTLVLLFDLFGFSLLFFTLSVLHTNVRGLSTAVSPGEQPSKTVFTP